MKIVRCYVCGKWIGKENDLRIETVKGFELAYCPKCRGIETFMDVDYGCIFDDAELGKLWELFGEIPIDDNDMIQEEFLGFPEGTDRIEVWQWFDERYSRGVVSLLCQESAARKSGGE